MIEATTQVKPGKGNMVSNPHGLGPKKKKNPKYFIWQDKTPQRAW